MLGVLVAAGWLAGCGGGDDPSERFAVAVAKHEAGDLDAALVEYDAVIAADPAFAEAFANRGLARFEAGDAAAAVQDFDRLLELTPGSAAAHTGRGAARLAAGDDAGAMADADAALAADALHAEAYALRGDVWMQQERWEAAQGDYGTALTLLPDMAGWYDARAAAFAAGSNDDAAAVDASLASLTREINAAPQDADPRLRRARAFRVLEEWDLALDDVNAVLEKAPDGVAALTLRAGLYTARGDSAAAAADLDAALAAAGDPASPEAAGVQVERGVLFESLGSLPAAAEAWEAAAASGDRYAMARLAWLRAVDGTGPLRDVDRGVELARAALALVAEDDTLRWYYLDTLASTLLAAGELEEAAAVGARAVEAAPDDVRAQLAGRYTR